MRLRHNVPLSDLLSHCVCGEKYTVCHALSCKKRGFMAQRRDGVRNLLTSFLGKVCTNVEVEPQLQPLDDERFNLRSAVTSLETGHEDRGLLVSMSYNIFRSKQCREDCQYCNVVM